MTTQKMLLPVTCETHLHSGYGPSKETPCPWCEIAKLRQIIADVMFREMHGLKPVLRTGDVEWAAIKPVSGEQAREHALNEMVRLSEQAGLYDDPLPQPRRMHDDRQRELYVFWPEEWVRIQRALNRNGDV